MKPATTATRLQIDVRSPMALSFLSRAQERAFREPDLS